VTNPTPLRITPLPVGRRASGFVLVAKCLADQTKHRLTIELLDTTSFDPLTFIAVPAILASAALLACLIPAERAARLNPVVALREG
jgi:putative ABC transport system permease protein